MTLLHIVTPSPLYLAQLPYVHASKYWGFDLPDVGRMYLCKRYKNGAGMQNAQISLYISNDKCSQELVLVRHWPCQVRVTAYAHDEAARKGPFQRDVPIVTCIGVQLVAVIGGDPHVPRMIPLW